MAYFYVATSQKPTCVNHSVVCNFTSPTDRNLVLARGNSLEIHTMEEDGLVGVLSSALYGKIICLDYFRDSASGENRLFVVTENKNFTVFAFDNKERKLVVKALSAPNREGKDAVAGQRLFVDPESRMIGMILNEGSLKIILNDSSGLKESINMALPETRVIDIKFLHSSSKPTLCILFEDNSRTRHVKTFTVDPREKELQPASFAHRNVDHSAHMLIPVSSPLGGVIVIASTTITYFNGTGIIQSVQKPPSIVTANCAVTAEGTRFLLGDNHGLLMVLALVTSPSSDSAHTVSSLLVENVGETSIAETLKYLENGIVFVGSVFGDSQLLKLHLEKDTTGSNVEVLDVYNNVGPISDMCLMDGGNAVKQLVTCSGAFKDGSLRVVRSGIGLVEQASVPVEGVKNAWSLRLHHTAEFDKYLVQSFFSETRILAIDEEQMEEIEIPGFSAAEPTLYCGNMIGGNLVQVTPAGIRLVDSETLALKSTTSFQPGESITVAAGGLHQVVVGFGGGLLRYFELSESGLTLAQVSECRVEHEVACLSMRPLGSLAPSTATGVEPAASVVPAAAPSGEMELSVPDEAYPQSNLLAVGLWTDNTIRLLSLPSLVQLTSVALGTETQARDVLLIDLCESPSAFSVKSLSTSANGEDSSTSVPKKRLRVHLMVGLGDGRLITYTVSNSAASDVIGDDNVQSTAALTLNSRRAAALGSQPIRFSVFRNAGSDCVLACCDRPTVIFLRNDKLEFSSLNMGSAAAAAALASGGRRSSAADVVAMAPFHCALFNDCLAIVSESALTIGSIEEGIQKIHTQTIPLGERPRRISYSRSANAFALCTEREVQNGMGAKTVGRVLFLEGGTFDLVGLFELDTLEMPISCVACSFKESTGNSSIRSTAGDSNSSKGQTTTPEYFVVGTAQVENEQLEPDRGRLLVFELTNPGGSAGGRTVRLLAEKDLRGAVWSVAELNGRLVAGIGSKVLTFRWRVRDDAMNGGVGGSSSSGSSGLQQAELVQESSRPGHIMTLYMKSLGDNLLVGDLLRSVSLLQNQPVAGSGDESKTTSAAVGEGALSLQEVARDFGTNFMRAVEIVGPATYSTDIPDTKGKSDVESTADELSASSGSGRYNSPDSDHFLGAEENGNIFIVRKQAGAASVEERGCLKTQGEFHVGDVVNVFARGSLVDLPFESMDSAAAAAGDIEGAKGSPLHALVRGSVLDSDYKSITGYPLSEAADHSVLFGTISGAIGNVISLSEDSYRFFAAVQQAVAGILPPLGGVTHKEYRSFRNDLRCTAARNMVDGDLVEQLLELSVEMLEAVAVEVSQLLNIQLSKKSSTGTAVANSTENSTGSDVSGASSSSVAAKSTSRVDTLDKLQTSSKVQLTAEDVLRRVEDIARMH